MDEEYIFDVMQNEDDLQSEDSNWAEYFLSYK